MYGPVVNIRHGKFFGGLSYLMGTVSPNTDGVEIDVDRTDIDLSAGYYVHPNVGLFLGYKMATEDVTLSIPGLSVELEREFSGPAFGVTGISYRGYEGSPFRSV